VKDWGPPKGYERVCAQLVATPFQYPVKGRGASTLYFEETQGTSAANSGNFTCNSLELGQSCAIALRFDLQPELQGH
jgi:hypothetical protein